MRFVEVREIKGLYIDNINNRKYLKPWEEEALKNFEAKLINKESAFPCIPATLGFTTNQFRYGFIEHLSKETNMLEFASILREYTETNRSYGKYTSLIVFFNTPPEMLEENKIEKFEQLFWKQLNGLSTIDQIAWPQHIPVDPHQPAWEFCFHGEPYFMYCATPAHKNRKSRHFNCFMLAITPRWVLKEFHSSPTNATKLKTLIRQRLENYDSIPPHPSLNTYGQENNYEWEQYFLHDDDTTLEECPFHKK
jgi:uncharacterized protein